MVDGEADDLQSATLDGEDVSDEIIAIMNDNALPGKHPPEDPGKLCRLT